MVFSVQQIKYEILAYMKELGGEFRRLLRRDRGGS